MRMLGMRKGTLRKGRRKKRKVMTPLLKKTMNRILGMGSLRNLVRKHPLNESDLLQACPTRSLKHLLQKSQQLR
jgi:hypothetical protein